MQSLSALLKKKSLNILGLMSGTSADGLDLSLCRITSSGTGYKVSTQSSMSLSYPPNLRQSIIKIASDQKIRKPELIALNNDLVDFYLHAIKRLITKDPKYKMDLIGSHGQTIYHADHRLVGVSKHFCGTWQIVDGAMLASQLGIPVVSDFRVNDIALGGSGAPLMPVCHFYMFRKPKADIAVLNIGGITNLTWLPSSGKLYEVQASDCGPGNMLIDGLMNRLYGQKYDKNGRIARQGSVSAKLLTQLKQHKWFNSDFPKSLGREQFNETMIKRIIQVGKKLKLSLEDLIATTSQLTIDSILKYLDYCGKLGELIVCGGGVHNKYLMKSLSESSPDSNVVSSKKYAIDPDYVEAAGFALFAAMFLHERPASLPWVTGAKRGTVLGKLSLP